MELPKSVPAWFLHVPWLKYVASKMFFKKRKRKSYIILLHTNIYLYLYIYYVCVLAHILQHPCGHQRTTFGRVSSLPPPCGSQRSKLRFSDLVASFFIWWAILPQVPIPSWSCYKLQVGLELSVVKTDINSRFFCFSLMSTSIRHDHCTSIYLSIYIRFQIKFILARWLNR